MNIDLIAGARPNFVKLASIIHAAKNEKVLKFRIIHTGQHYNEDLSGSFFKQLNLPEPEINLRIGSGSAGYQTARIMEGYENILNENKPSLCIVMGDVTSSMACAIAAKKMGVKVAHIEAGLRSYDWDMPEEINRVIIDSISDYYFTTTEKANKLLSRTGVDPEQTFFVGNTMIDTLIHNEHRLIKPDIWGLLNLQPGGYIILTLHRPSNVDSSDKLKDLINHLTKVSKKIPIIFPVHPRTKKFLTEGLVENSAITLIDPLSYLEFNYLVKNSMAVLTDSGGITEEATYLRIPCLTLRNNTERPETVEIGTNFLVGNDFKKLNSCLEKIISGRWKKGEIPNKWDGLVGSRIVNILKDRIQPRLQQK